MLKRTYLILSVILLVAAAVWLLRTSGEVEKMPSVGGATRAPASRPQKTSDFEAGDLPESEEIPESQRHAAPEFERDQAGRLNLVALDRALREQEQKVEEKRKALAAIVRTKGIIYKGRDSVLPADPAPDRVPKAGEEMEQANKEEAEQRGRDAMSYVDAKGDFETDQALLKQIQLKLDAEKQRLKDEGK